MKNLIGIILTFLIVLNVNAQNIHTQLSDGIIEKDYESFSILDPTKKAEPNSKEAMIIADDYMASVVTYTVPDFPSTEVKNEVQHAINHELITDDYKHVKSGGEMLVSYAIFGKDGSLKGDFTDNEAIDPDGVEIHKVSKGTLLISIIDRKSGDTVWSGFSDGALSSKYTMDDNQVIKTVSNILGRLRTERNY